MVTTPAKSIPSRVHPRRRWNTGRAPTDMCEIMPDALALTSISPAPANAFGNPASSIVSTSPGVRICMRRPSCCYSPRRFAAPRGVAVRGAKRRAAIIAVPSGCLVLLRFPSSCRASRSTSLSDHVDLEWPADADIRRRPLAPGPEPGLLRLRTSPANTLGGASQLRRKGGEVWGTRHQATHTVLAEQAPLLLRVRGRRDDGADLLAEHVCPALRCSPDDISAVMSHGALDFHVG